MKLPKEQTQTIFQSLPVELQDAILSAENAETIFEIGKKHGLLMDKSGELGEEIGYVMLGITKAADFPSVLKDRLDLPEEKVSFIVKDIDEKIFKPIRAHLIKLTENQTISNSPTIPSTLNTKVSGPDYDMSRDAILSAIENPTPADVKVSAIPHRASETTDPKEYLRERDQLLKSIEKTASSSIPLPPKKPSLLEEALLLAKKKVIEKSGGNINLDSKPGVPPINLPPASSGTGPTSLNVEPTATIAPITPSIQTPNDLARSATASAKAEGLLPRPPVSIAPTVPSQASNSPKTIPLATSPPITSNIKIVASTPPPIMPPLSPADKLNSVVQVPRTTTNMTSAPPAPAPTKSSSDPYREPV